MAAASQLMPIQFKEIAQVRNKLIKTLNFKF